MTAYRFNDTHIRWRQLGDFEHFVYAVLDIDEENNIADVLFKFEPNQQIVLHRHKVLNKTFVVEGEHRFYEADGQLREVCPVGHYISRPASDDPHRECGGDEGAIVLFSIRSNERGEDALLYEILDDEHNVIGTLKFQDLIDLYEQNRQELEIL